MTDVPDIAVSPLRGVSPEEAQDIQARCWDFVFKCWQAKQKGGPATAPNDAERSSSDGANRSIPK